MNETTNKMKRQPAKQKKIFANNLCDKGLIFKIYRELIKRNLKKKNYQIKRGPEWTFFQRHTDCLQIHENILKSLIIR